MELIRDHCYKNKENWYVYYLKIVSFKEYIKEIYSFITLIGCFNAWVKDILEVSLINAGFPSLASMYLLKTIK